MKKFFTKMICTAFITALCVSNVLAQEVYNITVLSNPSAGGAIFGAGTYLEGDEVVVMAIPHTCFEFINWMEDGIEVSTNNPYVFTVSGDRVLIANFGLGSCEITLSASPPEGGTVSGGGIFTIGTTVTVTAEANPDFLFLNWTENGNMVSTEADYSFPMYGPRSLVANFVPSTIEITLSKNIDAGGTVSGGGIYSYGQPVFISAYQNLPEYQFVNWTEDGNVVSPIFVYSFTATKSRHLVANFMPALYDIPVYANPYEGGTVTGGGVYTYGDQVSISAEANPDYLFLNWTKYTLGNGTVVSTEPDYTYEIIGDGWGNSAFVAYFEEGAKVIVLTNMPEGEVLGSGTYHYGDEVTVEAIPIPGYTFVSWTAGRGVLSTDNPYTFTVNESIVLVANFEEDGLLPIEPIDAGAMMIYPNPTTSDMTVVLNDATLQIVEMELYDLAGKKVRQQSVNQSYGTLKMSELEQGVYILKAFLNQGEAVVWKVVKQ